LLDDRAEVICRMRPARSRKAPANPPCRRAPRVEVCRRRDGSPPSPPSSVAGPGSRDPPVSLFRGSM
jgi:hypothetical protein